MNKAFYTLFLLICFSVSAQIIVDVKQSDIVDGQVNLTLNIEPVAVEPPIEPEPVEPPPIVVVPPIDGQVLFPEDLAEIMPDSTPLNPHVPLGLQAQFDIKYLGAFKLSSKNNESNSNYATGILGYNQTKNSIFMAGHAQHNAIAEFEIPNTLTIETDVKNIQNAKVLQNYVRILDDTSNNKINGLLVYNDKLLVTSEIWYDAGGQNKNNLQVLDVNNIIAPPKGMLQLEGAALIAGYMSEIPESATGMLGGEYIAGWSSVYSINNRYSHGPSMTIFNPHDAITSNLTVASSIKQVYPMEKGKLLIEGSHLTSEDIVSPVWGTLSSAKYGFIIPKTSLFMVVGTHAGLHGGVGYKIIQEGESKACAGSCATKKGDSYNYFWLYDVNDIVNAANPWDARPFSYGKWMMPFNKYNGDLAAIIGATFDSDSNRLYINLSGAGQSSKYGHPSMVVTFEIKTNKSN